MDKDLSIILSELNSKLSEVNCEVFDTVAKMIVEANRVYTYGCGRSGFSMRSFGMRIMHLGKKSYFVHDTCVPPICKDDLLIVASGSGNTESTLAIVKRAVKEKAKIVLVSGSEISQIQSISDILIYIPIKEQESVQFQGNCYDEAQFVILDTIIYKARIILGLSREAMDNNHTNIE